MVRAVSGLSKQHRGGSFLPKVMLKPLYTVPKYWPSMARQPLLKHATGLFFYVCNIW